ncbi:hypothetical protein RyT2_29020 [Pseudolactococcus yaeyamensis]
MSVFVPISLKMKQNKRIVQEMMLLIILLFFSRCFTKIDFVVIGLLAINEFYYVLQLMSEKSDFRVFRIIGKSKRHMFVTSQYANFSVMVLAICLGVFIQDWISIGITNMIVLLAIKNVIEVLIFTLVFIKMEKI